MNKIKISILAFSLLIVASVSFGLWATWDSTALDTSNWTEISIPQLNNPYLDISVFLSDNTAWIMAEDDSGTNPMTIPAGLPINVGGSSSTGGILFYAQAAAGTPSMNVFYKASK